MLGLALRELRMRAGRWSQSWRGPGGGLWYFTHQHGAGIVPSISRMLARDARYWHCQGFQTPVPFQVLVFQSEKWG